MQPFKPALLWATGSLSQLPATAPNHCKITAMMFRTCTNPYAKLLLPQHFLSA